MGLKVKGPLKQGFVLIGAPGKGAGKFRGVVIGEQNTPGGWVWLTTPLGRKVGVAPSDFRYIEEVPEAPKPVVTDPLPVTAAAPKAKKGAVA
jgi:hypothetical protein